MAKYTDDQQYTPSYEEVREATESDVIFLELGEFDRFLAERDAHISAAAEQRGERRAAKNLRPFVSRVAEHRALIGTETAREAKLLACELNRLEGDDEQV